MWRILARNLKEAKRDCRNERMRNLFYHPLKYRDALREHAGSILITDLCLNKHSSSLALSLSLCVLLRHISITFLVCNLYLLWCLLQIDYFSLSRSLLFIYFECFIRFLISLLTYNKPRMGMEDGGEKILIEQRKRSAAAAVGVILIGIRCLL